jgi:hypothetical protein
MSNNEDNASESSLSSSDSEPNLEGMVKYFEGEVKRLDEDLANTNKKYDELRLEFEAFKASHSACTTTTTTTTDTAVPDSTTDSTESVAVAAPAPAPAPADALSQRSTLPTLHITIHFRPASDPTNTTPGTLSIPARRAKTLRRLCAEINSIFDDSIRQAYGANARLVNEEGAIGLEEKVGDAFGV